MGDTSQKTFEAAVQREYQGEWFEPVRVANALVVTKAEYTGTDRSAEPVKLSAPEWEAELNRLSEMIRAAGDRPPPRPVAIHPALYERLKLLFEPADGPHWSVGVALGHPSASVVVTTTTTTANATYDLQVGPPDRRPYAALEAEVAKKIAEAAEAAIAAQEAKLFEARASDEDRSEWREKYIARKARAAGQRDEMSKHVHAELQLRAEVERLQKLVAARGGDLQCLTASLRSRESVIVDYQSQVQQLRQRIKVLEDEDAAWQNENNALRDQNDALRARLAELEKARDQPRPAVTPDDYEKRLRGERTARDWSQVPAFVPAGRTKALPVMRGGPAKLPRPAVMHCQGDYDDDDNEWRPEPPDPMEGCPW